MLLGLEEQMCMPGRVGETQIGSTLYHGLIGVDVKVSFINVKPATKHHQVPHEVAAIWCKSRRRVFWLIHRCISSRNYYGCCQACTCYHEPLLSLVLLLLLQLRMMVLLG